MFVEVGEMRGGRVRCAEDLFDGGEPQVEVGCGRESVGRVEGGGVGYCVGGLEGGKSGGWELWVGSVSGWVRLIGRFSGKGYMVPLVGHL